MKVQPSKMSITATAPMSGTCRAQPIRTGRRQKATDAPTTAVSTAAVIRDEITGTPSC
jgi:hypothetical protein